MLRPFHKRDDPNLSDAFLQAHVDGLGPLLLLIIGLVGLTLSGDIAWSEWWVLSPIWLCVTTWLVATVLMAITKPAVGSDALRHVAGTSRAMLFVMGSAVSLTMVFTVLRMLAQISWPTIQWSWWWVLVPLGINIAVWTFIYIAAVLFAHFVLGKIH